MSADTPTPSPWQPGTTRAMNLALSEPEVVDGCGRKGIAISSIEPLPAGGTHLVCVTIEGADDARALFKAAVISGAVRRFPVQRPDYSRGR